MVKSLLKKQLEPFSAPRGWVEPLPPQLEAHSLETVKQRVSGLGEPRTKVSGVIKTKGLTKHKHTGLLSFPLGRRLDEFSLGNLTSLKRMTQRYYHRRFPNKQLNPVIL